MTTSKNRRKFAIVNAVMTLLVASIAAVAGPAQATNNAFSLTSPVNNQKINLGAKDNWYLPVTVNTTLSGWPSFEFTGIFYDSTGAPVLQNDWHVGFNGPKSGPVNWTFKIGLSNVGYVENPVKDNIAIPPTGKNLANVTVNSRAYANQSLKQGRYAFELWAINTSTQSEPVLVADVNGIQIGKPSGVLCAPGTYSTNGTWTTAKACNLTSLGYMAPAAGAKKQLQVPAGTHGGVRGLTAGLRCDEGTYQSKTGQTSCVESSLGYFVQLPGAKSQTKCPAGKFTNTRRNFSCLFAEPGTFVSLEGQRSATPCAAGTYQPDAGAQHCRVAQKGYFVNGQAGLIPLPCPPGKYSNALGSATCIDAPLGSFAYGPLQDGGAATMAIQCSVGTYTSTPGSSYCVEADYGFYVSTNGAVAPTACPFGKTTASRRSMSASECNVDLPSL